MICDDSFDITRPFSPGGLYVSLSNWQGFGHAFLKLALERDAGCLYLHEMWKRVPKEAGEEAADSGSATMDTSSDAVGTAGRLSTGAEWCYC